MAIDSTWVSPGILPPIINTTPNSPTVCAKPSTVGEFGVVLMIGGNIPGETQVLSIAIYDHVEALEYGQAHLLSAGLLVMSFLMLLAVYAINRHVSLVRG